MTGCVYDGKEPAQPFGVDDETGEVTFDMPVCRSCGVLQHEALERIAQMVRPMKWSAPPGMED